MHEHTIQKLIDELIEFDPSLKAHEANLRVLVTHMYEKKPIVVLDSDFKEKLRASLLSTLLRKELAKPSVLSPWIPRLIPALLAFLLIFMVIPKEHNLPESTFEESIDVRQGDEVMFVTPEVMHTGGSAKMFSTDETSDSSFSSHMVAPLPTSEPLLIVDPQSSGHRIVVREAHLEAPGFIVVYHYRDRVGDVVMQSDLLPGGVHTRELIARSPLRVGETYGVRIVLDTGNGILGEEDLFIAEIPLTVF